MKKLSIKNITEEIAIDEVSHLATQLSEQIKYPIGGYVTFRTQYGEINISQTLFEAILNPIFSIEDPLSDILLWHMDQTNI